MSARGFQLAVLVLAFTFAAGSLGALGVYGQFGVSVDTGQDTDPEDYQGNDSSLVDPTTDTNNGVVDSIIDTVTPGLGVIRTITNAVRGTSGLLTNIGLPEPLAGPITVMILIAVGLSVANFIRGR
jgi:hypothetical protein